MTRLVDENFPVSGEVQFWRIDPPSWGFALDAVADLGIRHVATYLSWRRHEAHRGIFDFSSPRLDVRHFLDLCAERDLGVNLKPGPWICAEEAGGGLPDWVLQERELLALDHTGSYVLGYNPPFKHNVPSYASEPFRALAAQWLERVWDVVGDYAAPGGVIEAVQLDNEPSLAFQDAMYRGDYSDPAVDQFRRFILARYGTLAEVSDVWGLTLDTEAAITPPTPPPPAPAGARERDWADFHEHYISDYLAFLHKTICDLGGEHLTATVNLNTHPVRGIPQNGQHIAATLRRSHPRASIVVGEDHYFVPPIDEEDLAQLELGAALGRRSDTDVVWSPELQAGIWRSPGENVAYPDPLDGELAAWWGLSIAFGYEGFNLYMLVDRENWQYAPIDASGRLTPVGTLLQELIEVLDAIPGLARYRVRPEVNLVWDRDLLTAAYVNAGTQAEPNERWTTRSNMLAWNETLEIATQLTSSGLAYALCSMPGELVPGLPVVGPIGLPPRWDGTKLTALEDLPPSTVAATQDGVQARLLAHTDGSQILVVVCWSRDRCTDTVTLRTNGHRPSALVDVSSGATYSSVDGVFDVKTPTLGVRIFRLCN